MYIRGEVLGESQGTVGEGKLWEQELDGGKRENSTFPSVSFLFRVHFPTNIHALYLFIPMRRGWVGTLQALFFIYIYKTYTHTH